MLENRLKEFCTRHSVTRQTIGFIEKGEFSPSVTLSLKLARALDCDLNELFWLEGNSTGLFRVQIQGENNRKG